MSQSNSEIDILPPLPDLSGIVISAGKEINVNNRVFSFNYY
jgi:hypothetical protein